MNEIYNFILKVTFQIRQIIKGLFTQCNASHVVHAYLFIFSIAIPPLFTSDVMFHLGPGVHFFVLCQCLENSVLIWHFDLFLEYPLIYSVKPFTGISYSVCSLFISKANIAPAWSQTSKAFWWWYVSLRIGRFVIFSKSVTRPDFKMF